MQNPHAAGGERSMAVSPGGQELSPGGSSFSTPSRNVSASLSPTFAFSLPAAAVETDIAAPSSAVFPAADDIRRAMAAVAVAIEKEQKNAAAATEGSPAVRALATGSESDAQFLPPAAAGASDAAEPCAAAAAAVPGEDTGHNSLLLLSDVATASSNVPIVFHCDSAVLPHGEEPGDAAAGTTAPRQISAATACAIVRTENRVDANDSDQQCGLNAHVFDTSTENSCCHVVSQYRVADMSHDQYVRRYRCSSVSSHFSPSHSAALQHVSSHFNRRKSPGFVSLLKEGQNTRQEGVTGCRDIIDHGIAAGDNPVVPNADHLHSSSVSTASLTDTESHFTCDCTKEDLKKQHSAVRGRERSVTCRTSLLLSPSHKPERKNAVGSSASAQQKCQIPARRQSCRRNTDDRDGHGSHSSNSETHACGSRSPAGGSRIRAALPIPRWNSMPFRLLLSSCFSMPSTWRQWRNSNNERGSPSPRQARSHKERHSCLRVRQRSVSQKCSLKSKDSGSCCSFCAREGAIHSAATGASQAVDRSAEPSSGTAFSRCQCVPQQRGSCATIANTCASLERIAEKRADEEGKDSKRVFPLLPHFVDCGKAPSGVTTRCRDRRIHCRGENRECNRCPVLGDKKVVSSHKHQEKRQQWSGEQRQQQQQQRQTPQRKQAQCDVRQATTARRKNSISCRKNKVTHSRQRREISSRSHNTSSKGSTSSSSKAGVGWCFGRAGTTGHKDRQEVAVMKCFSPLSSSVSSPRSPPSSSSSSTCFGGFHMRNLVVKCGSIACVLPDDDEDFLEERGEWEVARVRRSEEEVQSRTEDAGFPYSEPEEGFRGLQGRCVCHKGRVNCRNEEIFHSPTGAMYVKSREKVFAGDIEQIHSRSEGKQCFNESLHVKRQCSCTGRCVGSSNHCERPHVSLSGWNVDAVGGGLYGVIGWPVKDRKVTANDTSNSPEATTEVDNNQHGKEDTYVTTV